MDSPQYCEFAIRNIGRVLLPVRLVGLKNIYNNPSSAANNVLPPPFEYCSTLSTNSNVQAASFF
jgi:hypothetical protein